MEDLTNTSSIPTSSKLKDTTVNEIEVKENSPKKVEDPEHYSAEGEACLKRGEIERSIEMFCKALEQVTKLKGELDPSLFKFYYQYADALLIQQEKENEGQIFGDMVPKEIPCSVSSSQCENEESGEDSNSEEPKDLSEDSQLSSENAENIENHKISPENSKENQDLVSGSDNIKENSEGSSEEDDSGSEESEKQPENIPQPEVPEEKNDDLEIAWECLESARVILKNSAEVDLEYLIKVITRIGDLLSYKEEFEKANEEYSTSLQLLSTLEGFTPSRKKAELYFLLGNNFLQVKGKENESAEHFTKALENLEGVLNTTKDISLQNELKEIIKEVSNKRDDAYEQKQSINALNELEENPINQFDAPTHNNNIIDLGVLGRRKREPDNDPDFPDKNEDKKPIN